jgi:cytochrome P450
MLPASIQLWDAFVANCQETRAKKQYALDDKSDTQARKDFFHWLWDAKDPETGKGYSLSELNAECEVLTIAGSDTTSTVLSALFFYLSRNRNVQNRLAQEISKTFASYDSIRAGSELQSCK